MTRVQTEIGKFETTIRESIDKHRGPYLPYAAIVGVLTMLAHEIEREASGFPKEFTDEF
jgi:hypothetical protein